MTKLKGALVSTPQFPSKAIGEDDHDSVAVLRDPMSTRPLCMKNTDNEIIASANCIALNLDFVRITHKTQNGFTQGRNFLVNLVDVDSASRMYSMLFDDLDSTLLRIFPSLEHTTLKQPFHQSSMNGSDRCCITGKCLLIISALFKASIKMLWPPMNIMVTFSFQSDFSLEFCKVAQLLHFYSTMLLTHSLQALTKPCAAEMQALSEHARMILELC